MDTFLSLIIPTRDRPLALARLLETLRPQRAAQPELRLEIIAVDDGSRPQERRKVEELFETEGAGLKLIRNETPLGPGGARNRGVDAARGEVLAFLDDDMVPEAGFLADLVRIHREHPDILVLNGDLRRYRRDIYSDFWFHYYSARFNISGPGLYQVPRLASGNLSIKRPLLRSIFPLFDSDLVAWEDFDLALRLRRAGVPIYKTDKVIAFHDVHSNLRDFLGQKAWYALGKEQVLKKYGPTVLAEEEPATVVPRKLKFLPLYAAQRLARWRNRLVGLRAEGKGKR